MEDKLFTVGRETLIQKFLKCIGDSRTRGSGFVFAISGEMSYGKSHILTAFEEIARTTGNIATVSVECQAPVGNFNIGNLQPLMPFAKAVEKIIENKYITPEKRFAMNVVMTTLASIPIAGEVFYAVKEMAKDWREFKKEKSSTKMTKVSSAAADYYDTICALADKQPLALLIDDFHWSDAQSIELLNLIIENIDNIPLILAFTYRKSLVDRKAAPLNSFIKRYPADTQKLMHAEMQSLTKHDLQRACYHFFNNYKPISEFEDWIYDHSYGVPGILTEYLKYFKQYSPFDKNGDLVTNFKGNEFLPATAQSLFSQALDKVSEEDRNILASCAAEGREFTANIVSQLLNLDVLATIKKLRSLQNKTGIIKSLGASYKYGIKTTVYQFTQAFYHSYFENLLEYEEYTALHGHIASLLMQKYNEAESDELREQIAPFLAAHSSASGDKETVKNMLIFAARTAQKYGSTDIARSAYDRYMSMEEKPDVITEEDTNAGNVFSGIELNAQSYISGAEDKVQVPGADEEKITIEGKSFSEIRNSVVNDYLFGNFTTSGNRAVEYIESHTGTEKKGEILQMIVIAAKAFLEAGDTVNAESCIKKAELIIQEKTEPVYECLLENVNTAYYSHTGNHQAAMNSLNKAARLTQSLSGEMKLITTANIAIALTEQSPESSVKYIEATEKLSKALNFHAFLSDLKKIL